MIYGDVHVTPPSHHLRWKCDLCGREARSRVQTLRMQTNKYEGRSFCHRCATSLFVKEGKIDIGKQVMATLLDVPLTSYEKIGEQYNLSRDYVRSAARLLGMGGVQSRRFNAVREFFEEDTAEKWWLVGWLVTDGCLCQHSKGSWYLSLASSDREAVEKTLDVLPVQHVSIQENQCRPRTSGWGRAGSVMYQWAFAVCPDTKVVLERFSIHPAKSKSTFVPSVPKAFLTDYIRGVVEGDGCFAASNRYPLNPRLFSVVSASEPFVRELAEALDAALPGVRSSFYQHKRTKCWYVRYQARDTTRIHAWLYPDHLSEALSLGRKRYVYQ